MQAPKRFKSNSRRMHYKNNIKDIRKSNELFADAMADPKSRFMSSSTAATERDTLVTNLKNPKDNFGAISATMRSAYTRNGLVTKVIDYFQSHPTYNHSIYPLLGNKNYDFQPTAQEDYIDVAYGLSTLNIKYFAPYFFKRMLLDGMCFFYKIQDKKGVAYIEFPIEWCRILRQTNGVYRYMIDMTKFNADTIIGMPKEIANAYEQYTGRNTDDTKHWYDNKWFYISDKGVAFTLDSQALINGGVAVSPFAGSLVDSLDRDKAKTNVEIKDTLDTIRIVHSKIPTNSEGVPSYNVKTARNYDAQMRSRLPKGVIPVTSPNNLTNVPLTGSGNATAYDTVAKSTEQMFYDMGVNASMFGGVTTSANIVRESIQKDANWIYTNVFPLLENYYNSEIASIKTKNKIPWAIKFIRQSNFTLKDDINLLKDQLSFGGTRLDYLAACGLDPIEIISKLQFEQNVMNIDDLMVVKPTSNTLSGGAQASDKRGGRPEEDVPTDDTDRINGTA